MHPSLKYLAGSNLFKGFGLLQTSSAISGTSDFLSLSKKINKLQKGKKIPLSSSLLKLDPIKDGILRVDSKLEKSQLSHESKHQTIFPKCDVIKRIIT